MTALMLIGGGGHCKAAIDVIEAANDFTIAGVIERPGAENNGVLGYPGLGTDHDMAALLGTYPAALVTIGQIKSATPRMRAFAAAKAAGADLPTIVSPRAYTSRRAEIGAGTLVMHGAVLNTEAQVGVNCILNSLALVEHDAQIRDHCHVSTGARINGNVTVEEGCFIGSGAILMQGVTIGAGSVIGAGCVIQVDVPAGSLVRAAVQRGMA